MAVLTARQAVGPVQEGRQLGRQVGGDGQDPVAAVALVVGGQALGAQLQVGSELGLVGYVQVEVDATRVCRPTRRLRPLRASFDTGTHKGRIADNRYPPTRKLPGRAQEHW